MSTTLDPYTTIAQNDTITPQQKIKDLHGLIAATKTAMFTTRSKDGYLHSRAMTPTAPHSEDQLNLVFIANNASHKFDDFTNDAHVNVSFYDVSTTNWVSYSGKAVVSNDQDRITTHWNPTVQAFFGNLNDGVHTGDEKDPRVSLIEVIPDEIRYWIATKGSITGAIETATSTMTGRVANLGELRTISTAEIQLTRGIAKK